MRRSGSAAWLAAALLLAVPAVGAQAQVVSPSPEARPRGEPVSQSSLPSTAPPASVGQTTGATSQDPTVREMNRTEKAKVEKEGK